ncbi:Asp-tRNA(Asn)/Glu-tRNA(Gln) amidotransferase subunit GatA [Candidatus Curtissbacteria bacterium]|nr:Asp-tRNA(Asn)/Glu-tRNA(Gln) amidotransferase subunit GatA [Candidatus Curtissbacteria bacterium]
MKKLKGLTIKEASKLLEAKEISAKELVADYISRAKKLNKNLNSFLTFAENEAIDQAERIDKLRRDNQKLSPLAGIPFAAKDIFSTKGIKTTAGSKVLESYIPVYDATVVGKLFEAGACIVGKTNQDAWAHGSSGENSDFRPTKNPYDTSRVPGGSSSGSAVATAADQVIFATGTDTGGSIRLPAAFCNVVGLKPTYGRVSRYGIIAMASSLDSIGHFTKTVFDNALVLNTTAGLDEMDATTSPLKIDNYTDEIRKSPSGLKVGLPKEYFEGLNKEIKQNITKALNVLERQGVIIENVSLPHTKYGVATYYIIQPSEVSSNLARYDGIRFGYDRDNFGAEAKRRIILGTYTLSSGYYDAYYLKAMKIRRLIRQDFIKAFKKVDVIITPTSASLPFKFEEKTDDPLTMYLSDIYTTNINLAGIPSLNVPCGFIDNLPTGMQIIGPDFSEKLLYRVGHSYEQESRWFERRPNL